MIQSRLTVRTETSSAAAVSSTLSPPKKRHFHPCRTWLDVAKLEEGTVEIEDVGSQFLNDQVVLFELDRPLPAAAFLARSQPGVIHENLAHRAARRAKEVGAAFGRSPCLIDELEERLVNEPCRVECAGVALTPQMRARHPAQLPVDEREEAVHQVLAARFIPQQGRDRVARGGVVAHDGLAPDPGVGTESDRLAHGWVDGNSANQGDIPMSGRFRLTKSLTLTIASVLFLTGLEPPALSADGTVPDVSGDWTWSELVILTAPGDVVAALFSVQVEAPVMHVTCQTGGDLTLQQNGSSFSGSASQAWSCVTHGGQPAATAPFPPAFDVTGSIVGQSVQFTADLGQGFTCSYVGSLRANGGVAIAINSTGGCDVPAPFHPTLDKSVYFDAIRQ
jgi:hypothetical protein